MSRIDSRRRFLGTMAASGAAAAAVDLGFLAKLSPVRADEARLDPKVVRLAPDIEPLVRLLEKTPRGQLLEKVADRIHHGTTYREVLASLLLAGVRNVQPRPSVGFKFHAVLVVNSAHLASQSSPDEHRWLPIFWALDEFKSSQAQDVRENNWTMGPVDESRVPPAHRARQAFVEAMDAWDESAADAATAGLVRTAGSNEVFELFARYAARDFRSIGHKIIYLSNAWRTLHSIGWQYAEPVMRSLAYALLMHDGTNPAKADLDPDRPWRKNRELAQRIGADWSSGRVDSAATRDMLATLRTASPDEACQQVVDLLASGVSPQSIWDAMFVGAGELLVRQPGIVALHSVTTSNAVRYAFETTADDLTRRMLLLQNAAFLPLFREAMRGRGSVKSLSIEQLEPIAPSATGAAAVDEIFAEAGRDRMSAARKILAYAETERDPKPFIDAARVLVFLKGNNSHDYKFSSAVLEDYAHVSAEWRPRFLASSIFNLRNSTERDNDLVARTRAALA